MHPGGPVLTSTLRQLSLVLLGFALLDAVFYLPQWVGGSPAVYVAGYVLFFAVAHAVGRLAGVGGLPGYGFFRHAGFGRNVLWGFAAGAALRLAGYAAEWALGGFRLEALNGGGYVAGLLAQALFGMLLSSATEDVLLRGYVFRHLSPHLSTRALVAVSTVVFVANHVVYVELTPTAVGHLVFFGLALAVAFARTGSLWLDLGLHWGSNVAFRLFAGFDEAQGGVVRTVELPHAGWLDWRGTAVSALTLAAALLLSRRAARVTPPLPLGEEEGEGAVSPALLP